MITGTARMDGGILVVSATDGAMPKKLESIFYFLGKLEYKASLFSKIFLHNWN